MNNFILRLHVSCCCVHLIQQAQHLPAAEVSCYTYTAVPQELPTATTVPVLITKEVECCQCGDEFVLTVSEQRFFYQKGLHLPKRCRACRALNNRVD